MRRRTAFALGAFVFAFVMQYATGLTSLAMTLRSMSSAWKGVVPRPQNGSKTTAPGFVNRFTQVSTKISGNIAKYGQSAWKRWLNWWPPALQGGREQTSRPIECL